MDINLRYSAIKGDAAQFTVTLRDLVDKHQKFEDACAPMMPWMDTTEKKLAVIVKEAIDAEPEGIKQQIEDLKVRIRSSLIILQLFLNFVVWFCLRVWLVITGNTSEGNWKYERYKYL